MQTAAQAIAAVRERLRPDSSTFWDDYDLVDAYNDALDEIADATEIYEIKVTVKRRKWSVYTDLRGALPSNVLRVTSVWDSVIGKWLDPTNARELDLNAGREWEKIIDVSRWWFMRGLWFLGTFPIPGDDMSPLRVHCSSLFPHVKIDGGLSSGLATAPSLPPDFETAIQDHMLSTLFADRGETKKSISHWNAYAQAEEQLKKVHDQRMSRDRIPRMGARR